ncbi:MAG: SMP-30/gluconolactonase/LRE family protein [Candidatus Rokubacteria bacterium]|nr:SMP-30/gluconolactonase/LRE family protein [Candidatus Rokubacteria bacterium]MBI4629810.1 SMP-30/gluconolactonase/LRE family protein [Candidatus Rokubacteria bacterium]
MELTRRGLLAGGTAAVTLAVTSRAFAQWQPSQRYPDPSVQIVDQSFARYRLALAKIERLATGLRWCEGPVWFGDGRYLLWSDIPNNRIMRWDEETGVASVFRKPSNFANGNTRDRQGRLLTCEHGTRRVSRTEYDGTVTTVADRYQGKPLNSPNDIVCKSDGSIWFTDPPFGILGYYEGYVAKPELPTNVYRVDGRSGQITVATADINRPNGLAFSPDESKLYIVEAGVTPRAIHVYDVVDGGARLTSKRKLIDAGPGTPDGFRCDVDGNLWCGWGMGQEGLDGVSIFNPDGKLIGRINLPERCANLCFGGTYRNRLLMTGSTSIYSLYVNTQGAAGG